MSERLPSPRRPVAFGPWTFDPGARELVHATRGYPVDFDRFRTSADVLDAIAQVAGKTWADDATIAGLVRAIVEILNPQGCLCSGGAERGPIDPAEIIPHGLREHLISRRWEEIERTEFPDRLAWNMKELSDIHDRAEAEVVAAIRRGEL